MNIDPQPYQYKHLPGGHPALMHSIHAQISGLAKYEPSRRTNVSLPLFSSKVPTGFPSPAEEHIEKRLSPNDYLIDQEDATFFVTIEGNSMIELGLMPGDKAVVDRSKTPKIGDVVLAIIDGEFTIKTLAKNASGQPKLMPANKDFIPIEIKEGMQFEVWGVVIGAFRRFS